MSPFVQGGNTGSAFAVNEETMEVYLARSGVLNFNSKPEYVLNMRVATDSSSTGLTYFDMRILIADDNGEQARVRWHGGVCGASLTHPRLCRLIGCRAAGGAERPNVHGQGERQGW